MKFTCVEKSLLFGRKRDDVIKNINGKEIGYMAYKVWINDNIHYINESERYEKGEYVVFDEAVAVCKHIADEYLIKAHKPGMAVDELYDRYVSLGESPFVIPASDSANMFSAWGYVKKRCLEICQAV